jgi:hypothetical protein
LTPWELNAAIDAEMRRKESLRHEQGYLASWIINCCSQGLKKPVTVEMIFPTREEQLKQQREAQKEKRNTKSWMKMMQDNNWW